MIGTCWSVDLGALGEVDVDVWAEVTAYVPATMYDRFGDPGSPAEGGEVEIVKLNCAEFPCLNDAIGRVLCDDEMLMEHFFDLAQRQHREYERDEEYA